MAQRSQELTEAISALITQHPFFAVLMLDLLEVVECEKFPGGMPNQTAATDSKHLFVNPKFFKGLAVKERMFVLAHEVMHVVYRHPQRMRAYGDRTFGPDLKPFNPKKYNYAGDYVINRALCDANVGKMPMNSLYHPDITANDIIDEVYCKIPDPPEDDQNWDQHMPGDPNDGPDKATIQRAVKSAQNAAKAQGKMPAGMGRLVDEICEPQVPWGDKIRKAITSTVGGDVSTWRRPNKRKLAVAPHFYWPGRTGTKSGPMAIEVDTSGSIGGDELSTFLGEIHGILTDVRPEKIHVMFVDWKLYNDEVVEIDDPNDILMLKQKAGGGGGTDMQVVFQELEQRQIEVEYVIVLTDGYCDFGEDRGIPTIWCITSDIKAPWGETINIKIQRAQREAA